MANYKMASKFVIEIEEQFTGQDGNKLYRVKGFNSLVFDEEGLKRLETVADVDHTKFLEIWNKAYAEGRNFGYHDAYMKGLNEGRLESATTFPTKGINDYIHGWDDCEETYHDEKATVIKQLENKMTEIRKSIHAYSTKEVFRGDVDQISAYYGRLEALRYALAVIKGEDFNLNIKENKNE